MIILIEKLICAKYTLVVIINLYLPNEIFIKSIKIH